MITIHHRDIIEIPKIIAEDIILMSEGFSDYIFVWLQPHNLYISISNGWAAKSYNFPVTNLPIPPFAGKMRSLPLRDDLKQEGPHSITLLIRGDKYNDPWGYYGAPWASWHDLCPLDERDKNLQNMFLPPLTTQARGTVEGNTLQFLVDTLLGINTPIYQWSISLDDNCIKIASAEEPIYVRIPAKVYGSIKIGTDLANLIHFLKLLQSGSILEQDTLKICGAWPYIYILNDTTTVTLKG